MDDARHIIEKLGLMPHPGGGWYRETWRAEAVSGERASATAVADRGRALASCVVSPAFDFAGFSLATPGWAPGQGR